MNLLPKASGTRPRVACEILPQGVVAARSDAAAGPLAAVARATFAAGAVLPGLKVGNVVDRVAVAAAIRKTMEQVGARSNARDANMTLVIPDAAVRVLLLEFDALPNRLTEALPLVRFRLKKLLPFDADEAMVTFQVMSTSKAVVRVLAVAIPRDVLSEYETAAREAGYEPGAVLPSTLAALAGLEDGDPVLVVNATSLGVTTAIVRGGILMLHRSVDLQQGGAITAIPLAEATPVERAVMLPLDMLPLVDAEASAGEWAAQEPLPEHGRNPYADRVDDEQAVQGSGGLTGLDVPSVYVPGEAPTSGFAVNDLQPISMAAEIAQAVSVAAAYFEDTLAAAPERVISAGPLGAEQLRRILQAEGVAEAEGLRVRELVESSALLADAVSASVPRAWLSGVMGALQG